MASAQRDKASTSQMQTEQKMKAALSPEDKVKRLYRSLSDQLAGDFLRNALKTCDKILRVNGKDELALETKAQLLIALERWDEAVSLLKDDEKDDEVDVHRVYCAYKQGKLDDALESLKELDDDQDRTVLLLKAQIHYRRQDYEASRDLYEQLITTIEEDSPELPDLEHNLRACEDRIEFIESIPTRVAESSIPPLEKLETHPVSLAFQADPRFRADSTVVMTSTTALGGDADGRHSSKQQRKRKLPKGLDPETAPPPDPNRWLPKKRRPEFAEEIMKKRARTRKGNKLATATQGAAAASDAPLATGASTGGAASSSNKSSGKSNKNKKKKGKK